MTLYQQASIYGVGVKFFFAMPTETFATPVQLSLAYSPNKLISSTLPANVIQTLNTFQTMPCNQNKSINRYFALYKTKKKLGIDFFNCPEFI